MHRLAFLTLVLAACSSTETFTDAGGGDDTSVDANTDLDAAPSGNVHVITYARNGGPPGEIVANVEVVVVGLDGTLRDRDQTDDSGEAILEVVSGDTVTAIYDLVADNEVHLTTFAGVKPGDDLQFGDAPQPVGNGTVTGTMTLTWPGFTGATSGVLVTDCGAQLLGPTATTATFTHTDLCQPPTFSAMVYSLGAGNQLVQWAELRAQPFTDTGTAAFPALSGAQTLDIAVTGVSPEIDREYDLYAYTAVGDYTLTPAYPYYAFPYYAYASPVDGVVSASLPFAGTVDGTMIYENLYRNGNFGTQYAVRRLDPGVLSLTTPIAPLPWLADSIVVLPEPRLVQWFTFGAAAYDVTHVDVDWYRDVEVPRATGAGFGSGSGSTIDYHWDFILPPGLTMLAFPELPEELAAYAPASDTRIGVDVNLFESTAVADYDAVRALPEWEIRCLSCVSPGDATVPTVRTSQAYSGGGSDLVHPGSFRADHARANRVR